MWDATLFDTKADYTGICGATLIISGCLMSLFAKHVGDMLPKCSRADSSSAWTSSTYLRRPSDFALVAPAFGAMM